MARSWRRCATSRSPPSNLQDIVETIIDYSVMEDVQLGLNPTLRCPLRAAVATALEQLGERYKDGAPAAGRRRRRRATLTAFADADRLVQVLRALIDNAVKFSDEQGRVTVSVAPVGGDHGVRIEIADQGVGIPASELPRIFERFYQVDNSATRKYGGAGMGLALVKRLVDRPRGRGRGARAWRGRAPRVILLWPGSPVAAAGARARRGGTGSIVARRSACPPGRAGTMTSVALDGALAVPCTRNPLQRGRIPHRGGVALGLLRALGADDRVLRSPGL